MKNKEEKKKSAMTPNRHGSSNTEQPEAKCSLCGQYGRHYCTGVDYNEKSPYVQ